MPKNDPQEAYEKLMSANHGRMIDFVKFAEAKNAALLTFCSVWMGAIITLLRSATDLPLGYDCVFKVALLLLLIAAMICLKSLLPRFLDKVHKRESDYRNLLYFGDIARSGVRAYPIMAEDIYLPTEGDSATATYLHDLAVQTAINAKIAHRKFMMFHWAGSIVLLVFAIMFVPPLICAIRWLLGQIHC